MKKLWKFALTVLLAVLVVAALALAACNPNDNPQLPQTPDDGGTGSGSEHQHTFAKEWSSNDVEHWHNPTCNDTTERADVATHTFRQTSSTEPTCTGSGSITKQCTVCGKIVTGNVNPTGHSFSNQWSSDDDTHWHDATCNHNVKSEQSAHNYVNGVCITCQHAHINHTFGKWIEDIPATQNSKGHRYQECACGKRNEETIPMLSPFTFTQSGNGLAVTGYIGTQTDITIPAEYEGKKVIAIAEQAFYYSDITSVSLPDSIKEIGNCAFGYCTKLKTVNIPHCTRIGDSAFIGCAALREITLPEDVVTLGNALFNYCGALQKVTILGGTIGSNTFSGGTAIQEIIVGDKITSIEQNAFVACTNLKYLTLPRVETGVPFISYYFNLKKQTYTYYGNGDDEVEADEYNFYNVGNSVFGLPKDGTDWYCLKKTIEVYGNVYHYSGKPISVSSFERAYELTVGVYYYKPESWTAEFVYYPECPLERLTVTNQLISTYDDVFEGCGCSLDIWKKYPVSTLEVKGATEVYIDEFSWSDYTLYVTRTDGYKETYPLLDYVSFEETDSFEAAGENTVTAVFEEQTITQTITLKLHTFDDAVFESKECIFNGSIQSLEVTGVPDGTKIEYFGNGQAAPGEYTVTATLTKEYYEPKMLTATLKILKQEYEIHYVLGFENAENANPSTYVTDGEDITLQDPVRPGWEFLGWYTEETFNNKLTSIKGNAHIDYTLYAKWQSVFVLKDGTVTGLTEYGKKQTTLIIDKTINGVDVTSIGKNAFYYCSNLTSITIPSTVTSIGENAFNACNRLTIYCEAEQQPATWNSYWNPDSRPVVWNCCGNTTVGGVAYGLHPDNTATVANRTTDLPAQVTIPQAIDFDEKQFTVTSIGGSAFYGCSQLTEITIPSTVTSIGSAAFQNCTNLQTVTFDGDSQLRSIGGYAFYNCTNLQTVTFESDSQLQSIGGYAFEYCGDLTSIIIPSTVTSIGNYAFCGCSQLTIYCEAEGKPSGWDSYWNPDSRPVVWNCCGITTIGGVTYGLHPDNTATVASRTTDLPAQVTIPQAIDFGEKQFAVTSIGDRAFRGCSSLTSITIPNTVIRIGNYAFSDCNKLQTVKFEGHNKLQSIGDGVFNDCDSLTSIVIPSAVTNIGNYAFDDCDKLQTVTFEGDSQLQSIGNYAFSDCNKLQTVKFEGHNKLQSIGDGVFNDCDSLTSIVIPSAVTNIGNYAFGNCDKLQTVTFEGDSQLQSIGYSAFERCSNLTNVYYGGTIESWCGITFGEHDANPMYYAGHFFMKQGDDWQEVTKIDIPESVDKIGDWQFCGFKNITSILIPITVTSIGNSAFDSCTNLQNVYYGGTIESWCSIELKSSPMGGGCHFFMKQDDDWQEVTKIVITDGVETIGNRQFYGFENITSITIPSTVTSIGDYAFYYCSNLQTVTFEGDSQLQSIGSYAFYRCSNLMSIIIRSTVTSIGENAFGSCSSSLKIYCEADQQPSTWNSRWNPSNRPVVWNCCGITTIGGVAYGLHPDNTATVASWTTDLPAQVTIPQAIDFGEKQFAVTSIGDRAFSSCSSLTSITIPNTVTRIGDYAFVGCDQLTIYCEAASKPSGWDSSWNPNNRPVEWNCCGSTTIGGVVYVLHNDNTATVANTTNELSEQVTIPQNVEFNEKQYVVSKIGSYAFYNCSRLTSIVIPSTVTSIGKNAFGGCGQLTIYCEAASKPSGWDSGWNPNNRPVEWGYKQQ